MKLLGAHEDVVCAGDSLWIEIGRKTGIGNVFIWVMPTECILDAHLMRTQDVKKIFTRELLHLIPCGPITLAYSGQVLMSIRALISEPTKIVVLELMEMSMESKEAQSFVSRHHRGSKPR